MVTSLELFQESIQILKIISKSSESPTQVATEEEFLKLLLLFEQRLQFCLRTLTKLFLNSGGSGKKDVAEANVKMYKLMFGLTLRQPAIKLDSKHLAEHLIKVLQKISELKKNI